MTVPTKTIDLLQGVRPAVKGLGESATLHLNRLSAELAATGVEVFRFGFGQSPFPIPPTVVDSLRENAHQRLYIPSQGLAPLREAIADYLVRRGWSDCGPENVLVAPGSKELLFLFQVVWAGETLLPTPSWVSYEPQARLMGNSVRPIPSQLEDGWKITPEGLEKACSQSSGPFVLILNYPSNPAGTTYRADELKPLSEVARKHGIVVIADEIYAELDHQGRHASMARFYPEGTIISTGLSKWCGAGGWRLGAFVFPRELESLRRTMTSVASESYSCVASPVQFASTVAYQGGPEIERYLDSCRAILALVGKRIWRALEEAGIPTARPDGAFYLFPDFEPFRERLLHRGVSNNSDLCRVLLEETGVAILAGSAFGCAPEALAARLAYVDFDGDRLLAQWTEAESPEAAEQAALQACGRMLEGIGRMGQWLRDR